MAQIARTVRYVPEVMVKVTGGGTSKGAVAAHLVYVGRRGSLDIETDDGQRIARLADQRRLLADWHLELTAGQYRSTKGARRPRPTKLVHNIVLSMPAPTPADKVLAAARKFALDKFAFQHRYAMVMHDDQANPHVHLVVKAESELGHRLHIDKQMLREWREHFAQLMREQGVAANATPRALRGRNNGKTPTGIFKARRYGESTAVRKRLTGIARELTTTGGIKDPARARLLETRRSLISAWTKVAEVLDAQGEVVLASEVRSYVERLPPVLTDREQLAAQFIRFLEGRRAAKRNDAPRDYALDRELTR